jgi:hypothetical protein
LSGRTAAIHKSWPITAYFPVIPSSKALVGHVRVNGLLGPVILNWEVVIALPMGVVERGTNAPTTLLAAPVVNLVEMHWSPNSNLLLVSSLKDHRESTVEDVLIYDPDRRAVVFQRNGFQITGGRGDRLRKVEWTPDGKYIAIMNSERMKIIALDGTERASLPTSQIPYTGSCDFGTLPHWLADGRLAYLSQYPKIFNVLTPTRYAHFPLSIAWRGG